MSLFIYCHLIDGVEVLVNYLHSCVITSQKPNGFFFTNIGNNSIKSVQLYIFFSTYMHV